MGCLRCDRGLPVRSPAWADPNDFIGRELSPWRLEPWSIAKRSRSGKFRTDLSAAYRLSARAGYDDGIWNHFSVRVPGRDDRFLVKPHGLTFDEVTAGGTIAVGCGEPQAVDDAHLVNGKYAILQQQTAEDGRRPTGAIYLTSLRTSASTVMLNVETGDYAIVERRRCGCPLGEVGFDLHLYEIRSYEKLTTEGMHFLGSSLIELVEEVLPRRFGGKPNDYQFVETEVDGLRRVDMVASPRIGNLDEQRRHFRDQPEARVPRPLLPLVRLRYGPAL